MNQRIVISRMLPIIGVLASMWLWSQQLATGAIAATSKSINAKIMDKGLVITTCQAHNPNNSFTTENGETGVHCVADLKPDDLDAQYNSQIEWDLEDDPGQTGDSGDPPDPQRGADVNLTITAPAAANGRGFRLNYQIKAWVVIDGETIRSDPKTIIQDELDQCRQEYIDMNKATHPARAAFVNAASYVNPGHFSFGEVNHGDYSWALFTIGAHVENVRTAMNTGLTANSGYRNPVHNAAIGGAAESRHIYGQAADIGVRDFNHDGHTNFTDWNLLATAAQNEGGWVEPYSQTGSWVHMDWGH